MSSLTSAPRHCAHFTLWALKASRILFVILFVIDFTDCDLEPLPPPVYDEPVPVKDNDLVVPLSNVSSN